MLDTDIRKEILILDRDVAEIEPLRLILRDAGFVTTIVTEAAAALTSLSLRPPNMAIIDWNTAGRCSVAMN
jgi:DNA-binding response OmpR family regulator